MESPYPLIGDHAYQRVDRGSQVLVVEDVSVTQEFLKRILADGGYRVTLAATAGEAIRCLGEELPALVLLDLMLPDANGLEVCRYLRTLAGGEDIPVLIITVDERPSSHAEAVRAGADDFLRKPLLPAELQTRVRSLIRLRRLRAELRLDREAILTLQAQKDQLVQFVVHDLNNMLGALICSVELVETAQPQDSVRHLKRVEDSARTMQAMVQNMLDLSMQDQAGLTPQLETVALGPWMDRLHLELASTIQRRNQTLAMHVEADLTLLADQHLLQRVLFNLMENASKYGPPASEIQVRAFRAGGGVRIQVTDAGQGIPEETKQLIFDRYMRLGSGTAAPPGQGLGLAFCRLVMELHGGRSWVEDHEPRGSRFLLEFPA